jgi:hypothetical protein
MSSATGKEIAKYRRELTEVLVTIMNEHSARCAAEGNPCKWQADASDRILCDLEQVMESYHFRREAAYPPTPLALSQRWRPAPSSHPFHQQASRHDPASAPSWSGRSSSQYCLPPNSNSIVHAHPSANMRPPSGVSSPPLSSIASRRRAQAPESA